ncbi:MAG: GNAT family N-acetyltransferase [Synergistaceae bacterium]|nr:GNAT family N-acetyltransferase [Synergistaceae bacterium]
MTIRDFVSGDRDEYMRMSDEFYSSEAVLHPITRDNLVSTFEQCLLGNPLLRGLMLEKDGAAAGYALLSFTWSNEAGGLCVLLEEAYIVPRFRGEGLGSALIRHVEKEYDGKARRFRLEVTQRNERAIRLYERMGFGRLDYAQMTKDIPGRACPH